ncbi:MAG: peroxiredoxin family protein [Rudaea sp.]
MARPVTTARRIRSGSPPFLTWMAFALGALMLVGGAVAMLGQLTSPTEEPGSEVAVRVKDAVDFTLPDFSGKAVHLADYRGRPVLVNLWASWCPPCRAEMPDLVAFYQQHQTEGLVMLAVDSADTREKAEAFMRNQPMPFTVLYDPKGKVMDAFGVQGLPSTFLIDGKGKLLFAWTGQITPGLLNSRVAPILSQ